MASPSPTRHDVLELCRKVYKKRINVYLKNPFVVLQQRPNAAKFVELGIILECVVWRPMPWVKVCGVVNAVPMGGSVPPMVFKCGRNSTARLGGIVRYELIGYGERALPSLSSLSSSLLLRRWPWSWWPRTLVCSRSGVDQYITAMRVLKPAQHKRVREPPHRCQGRRLPKLQA